MKKLFAFLKTSQQGQSLVELMIAFGLLALLLPALLTGFITSRSGKAQQGQRAQAITLLRETQDAVRSVRNSGWTVFATASGTMHPVIYSGKWNLVSGAQTINGITRQVVIGDVNRDVATGAIVATPSGTLDPSTKSVTVTVSWTQPRTSSISSTAYLTRYMDNLAYKQTTYADFATNSTTNGTFVATSSGSTTDGEVKLTAAGGGGDWCQPNLTLNTVDLPKSGVANAISAIEGRVFAGTGDNSSGVSFANVNITTSYPPSGSVQSTFDGYKTNAVFGETNYAYLGTDSNGKEIVIIDLTQYSDPPTNSKYKEVGYFNAPGNSQGNSIYVTNNTGYMTAGDKFYIFDLSGKTGSRSQLNPTAVSLAGTGNKVLVVGNYAYVATNSTTSQLQIIDVSNTSNPSIVGSLTVDGLAGRDLAVNSSGTRVYLATAGSSTKKEFFIIDTTSKTSPSLVSGGTYDTSGMDPKGVTVVIGNRAIIVGTGGVQYQVINIASENTPTQCGSLSVASGINGIASVLQADGYAYSYIITGDASSELKIILGGGGANSGLYATSGTFISSILNPGYTTAFNKYIVTYAQPSQTTLKFQFAAANAVNGSCNGATYSYIGPDKTSGTYFTATSSAIPLLSSGSYQNPGQCLRYKAFFTSNDVTQSPELYDISINYSP